VKKIVPDPVKIDIQEVTGTGQVLITFSENLVVPKYNKTALGRNKNSTRLLKTQGTVNLREDIIDIIIRVKSDQDEALYSYDLYIESWNETMMVLEIVFENPYSISLGKILDSLNLDIKNYEHFKS